jgi:hypothetical protein
MHVCTAKLNGTVQLVPTTGCASGQEAGIGFLLSSWFCTQQHSGVQHLLLCMVVQQKMEEGI